MVETIGAQAKDALRRHVLEPLLTRCIDETYGGFLVDFDDRWRSVGPHEKSLEHAARTTMSFALLHLAMPNEGCDRLASHGSAFLEQVMWDSQYGGFFARVDRSGQPLWDGLKHPHGVTYAAQAFEVMKDLLPSDEGVSWARRALDWLDDVAWDDADGGYWGSYRRNNERYAEGTRLPTPDGRDILGLSPSFKEINTQGDAIEMLTHLVEGGVGGNSAVRLEWIVDLVTSRLIDRYGVLPYAYRRDWSPAPSLIRVGYQFEMARRLPLLPHGHSAARELTAKSCQLVDFCLASARHPDGGFCFATSADGRSWPETGSSSDLRQWWVQLEAIYALHVLCGHKSVDSSSRGRYRQARDQQWSFVCDHFFDRRYGGIRAVPLDSRRRRFSGVSRDTWRSLLSKPLKSHPWKDPYHEVSTLLALALDQQPQSLDQPR